MPHSQLDHIVITATSLAVGVEYLRQTLGIAPQVGGEHPHMGTHNYFLKLGEKLFLEVIAINPQAPRPDRPRWFGLDALDANQTPRVAAWIARTDDIHAAASAAPVPLGKVEPMSRGDLNWLITVAPDGSPPLQGIAPMLIQWPPGTHPTNTLQDAGCSLLRFEGFHPEPEKVRGVLRSIGLQDEFAVSPLALGARPYLVAHIQTPTGPRRLSGL